MSEEDFLSNIDHIKKHAKNGSTILYWNMQNRRYIKDKDFVLDEELSRDLFKANKAWFYRDLLIYRMQK